MDIRKWFEIILLVSVFPIFAASIIFSSNIKHKGDVGEDKRCQWCQSIMRGNIYGEYRCEECD